MVIGLGGAPNVAATVGVPLTSPLLLMAIPGGGLFMPNLYGGTPPVAVICWAYGTPTKPLGSGEVVVMVGVGLTVMVYATGFKT
jgi:hypothetical protein